MYVCNPGLGSDTSSVWNFDVRSSDVDSPRSSYSHSDMTLRPSGQFSIFGLVFFVLKSLPGNCETMEW